MDPKSPTTPKGEDNGPKSTVPAEYEGIITGYEFFGTLPEYLNLSSIAEFTSVDIHPTKPLVVTADVNQNIVVWNYNSKSIVYRTSAKMLFDTADNYRNQMNGDVIPLNETNDSPSSPMSGLKSVMFYDNDTLLWSNNAQFSPVASQCVIAVYDEGFMVIDYIAQTALEVRNETHLQQLQATCVMPLNGQYLLVGTNGHLCVYNMVDNRIQTSVAHLNVTGMAPYKKMPAGSLAYQHASNTMQVIAMNSQNLAICWDIAIGTNNEFISITPAFACLDGAISQGVMNKMVVSADLDKAFFLSDNYIITSIDLSATTTTCTSAPLKELGVTVAIPTTAMVQKTVSVKVTDIAIPITPALPASLVPMTTGTHLVCAVDMATGQVVDLTSPACWPEDLGVQNQITKVVVMPSTHTRVAVVSQYGVEVLGVKESVVPAVVAVKNEELMKDGLAHVLVYQNGEICHKSYDLEEVPVGSALNVTYPAAITKSSKRLVTDITAKGTPSMEFNCDGSKLAVVFGGAEKVMVYDVKYIKGEMKITLATTREGKAFAWSYVPTKYAVLEKTTIVIYDDATSSRQEVMIPGESTNITLFSGYFLGVGMIPSETEMRSSHIHTHQLQLFTWDIQEPEKVETPTTPMPGGKDAQESTVFEWKKHHHLKTLGSRIPLPQRLIEVRKAALMLFSYGDKTAIYRVENGFELVTIVNHSVMSAYYQNNCLFLCTPTAILLLLLNKTSTTSYTLASTSSLATLPPLQASIYSNTVVYNSPNNPLLPPLHLLPTGVCGLLTLFKGHLLFASASGTVRCLPLNHPSIRFIMLMAADQVDKAIAWTKLIRKDEHDAVAYVLQYWGHIEKCLELPGLSPALRLSFQLSREDVPSIVKIVKKGDLSVLDQADVVNVDYRVTPVDQLPGVRRAAILLAKSGKKEELKKLFKLCQKTDRDEDAEFVANFLYKEDPSLLLAALKKENKYHDAALLSKMNTKYHKELPELVQAWNQQLKTEARSSTYLAGVEMVLEESAKSARKSKATTKTATAKGKAAKGAAAAEGGRRRGRRRG